MSFFENWNKKSEEEKSGTFAKIVVIGLTLFLFIYTAYRSWRDQTSKGKLAKEYEVSIKVLMKWLDLFGSEDAKRLYLGNTGSGVNRNHFYDCLGKPEDYQKDKDGFIYTKSQISKAGLVSERTLLRRISKLENPEEVIEMSLETYRSMKYFPPKHANLIIEYLKSEQA